MDKQSRTLRNIDQYDTDGDGVLDADEQRRMLTDLDLSPEDDAKMRAALRDADTDGDGKIDRAEMQRLKKEKKKAKQWWLFTCCGATLLIVWTLVSPDTQHNYLERLEAAAEGIPGLDMENFSCDDPCPYAHDGECDVSYGLIDPLGYDKCPPNTDWLDCDPCASKEDGQCDTRDGFALLEDPLDVLTCANGTDFMDCQPELAASCGWLRACPTIINRHECEGQGSYRGCVWNDWDTPDGEPAHHPVQGFTGGDMGECSYVASGTAAVDSGASVAVLVQSEQQRLAGAVVGVIAAGGMLLAVVAAVRRRRRSGDHAVLAGTPEEDVPLEDGRTAGAAAMSGFV